MVAFSVLLPTAAFYKQNLQDSEKENFESECGWNVQPEFQKCWELKYFQITWANILYTIEHREHNKCLNGEILHLYPLNELISNLMPSTGLKKVGTGANKARHFEKIQLDEYLATN